MTDRARWRGYPKNEEIASRLHQDGRRDAHEKGAGQAKGFGRRSLETARAYPPRATMDKTTEALIDASVGDFAETAGCVRG